MEGGICELEWLRPHPVTLGCMEFYGFSTHHWDDPWTPGFRVMSLRGVTLPEFAWPRGMWSLPVPSIKGCGRVLCTADVPPGPAVTAKDRKEATRDSAAFRLHPSWIALSLRPLVSLALGTLEPCYCSFHKATVKPMTRAKTLWFIGVSGTQVCSQHG